MATEDRAMTVLIGEKPFNVKPTVTAELVRELGHQLKDLGKGILVLEKARTSFEMGGADYRGGLPNLLALTKASREAVHELVGLEGDIEALVEPEGVLGDYQGDERTRMAIEVVARIHRVLTRPAQQLPQPEAPAVVAPAPEVPVGKEG